MSGRLIAIGDIHGDIVKLNSLLKKLRLKKNDTVVFLGDYIDRGYHSKEVIERLIELSKKINCIFLKGNHEDMLLKILQTKKEEDIAEWLMSGGITTYDNYGDFPTMLSMHRDFLENLKLYYLTEGYLFVHAGIRPDKALDEQEKEDFLWIRDNFIYKSHNLKQKIIFGHTPFEEPFIDKDKIGINTGCGIDEEGYLTAFICGIEKFVRS